MEVICCKRKEKLRSLSGVSVDQLPPVPPFRSRRTRTNVNTSFSKPGALVQLGVPVLCVGTSRAVRVSSLIQPPSLHSPLRPPPKTPPRNRRCWASTMPSAHIKNKNMIPHFFMASLDRRCHWLLVAAIYFRFPKAAAGRRGSGAPPPRPPGHAVSPRLRHRRVCEAATPVENAPPPDRAGRA